MFGAVFGTPGVKKNFVGEEGVAMEETRGITRRSFIGASAFGVLGMAGGGALAGCTPSAPVEQVDGSASSAWREAPQPIADDAIAETHEADIVILGAGQAGSCAARAAAEAGANVIVIEMQPEDTYAVNGSEVGSINSGLSLDRGAPRYDPADLVRECLLRSMNRADARLMKQYAEQCGPHVNWFMEPLGEEWRERIHSYMTPPPQHYKEGCNGLMNFIGTNSFFGGEGYSLTDAMIVQHQLAKDAGARFFFGTVAEQPVMDDGACVGLIGKTSSGEYAKFVARKGVLLCGGGFSANEEMVRDLLKEYAEFKGDEPILGNGRDGSGIRIGVWAGGHVEEDPRAGTYSNQSGMAGSFAATAFLRLDANGERYSNEGMYGAWGQGAASLRQASPFVCCVFDSNWREELEYQPPDHFCVDVSDEALMESLTSAMEAIEVGPEGGDSSVSATPLPFEVAYHYWAANTVEELAEYLGFEGPAADNFVASVVRYNELCEKGIDEDFGKDASLMHPVVQPPFYGYKENKSVGNLVVTLSGLRIDHNQQVLNDAYEPIRGLFACGNNSGGRFAVQYMTPMGGLSVGMAQTLGHVLGEYVAGLDDNVQ